MTDMRDLLIEIGTEELPPKALRRLSLAFADNLSSGLETSGLKPSRVLAYAAPRRLALLITNLPAAQQDQESVRQQAADQGAFGHRRPPLSS